MQKLFHNSAATQLASKALPVLRLVMVAVLMLAVGLATSGGAHAAADAFTLDSTPYSGTITQVGSFVQQMVTNYGIPAILVSMVVMGWHFVKRLAQSAFH